MKKKVVLVEDNIPLQRQLVELLNSQPDIHCPLAVSSAEEAIDAIPAIEPDVIVMDINLPGMSGINCLPLLRSKVPDAEILMLTAYEEDDNIFKALKAGASGYLLKSSNAEELFNAIRDVHSGGSAFSSHIARKVVRYFQIPIKTSTDTKLSNRERQVLDLLATGLVYKEIGDAIGIHEETVRTYVRRICLKMQVRNRVEAIIKYHS
ncbi:MAG TPA: response regulator transcription factor [Rariglobus sp.]|jgi:DNA-binding NarL/FixJ family response regulator|nr:response regulator transcription factor [Rariglobus sp.]